MNYYKRHLGDYARKTAHLTALEHGVYGLLIDACYIRERGLTYAEALRFARATGPEIVAAVESVLAEFFMLSDGVYVQPRIAQEIAHYRDVAETNRQIALAREEAKRAQVAAGKRKKRTSTNRAPSVHEPCTNGSPSHKPLAISHKKETATSKAMPSRASRLPADWQPSPELILWAQRTRPDIALRIEIECFCNYWHSRPGAGALKLDWQKTFRNWIHKAHGAGHGNRKLSAVEQIERDFAGFGDD